MSQPRAKAGMLMTDTDGLKTADYQALAGFRHQIRCLPALGQSAVR